MISNSFCHFRRGFLWCGVFLAYFTCRFQALALPTGGAVQSGSATISTSGLQMNIAQSSSTTLINWTGFNIAQGETVKFAQPATTSVAWNFITDANASSISGNLNANGVVILQNPNGFTVSGTASINTHSLIMTTASSAPPLNFTANGPWTFSAPSPSAQIMNLGQITTTGNGGSVFLIASDIENNGTISAPNGKIGLYAGEQVLVTQSLLAKSLSAQVTLPQGSVDNQGNLIANAGTIAAQAQYVNQNGFVQANSAQNVNGTIQLIASDTLNLNASSTTSAEGTSQTSGGGVTLQAGNAINNNGSVVADASSITVTAPTVNQNGTLQANALGSIPGAVGINASTVLNLLASSDFLVDNLNLSAISITSVNGNINLTASGTIDFVSSLGLNDSGTTLGLNLSAGDDITLNNGAAILAGQNWNVTLNAGSSFATAPPVSGTGGIYLNGGSFIQAQNGNITLDAINEVMVGSGAIRTVSGGNISVTAEFGGVNTGTSASGFNYHWNGTGTEANPYYTPFALENFQTTTETINFSQSNLGGISTAAGGNVTIKAGGDVTSFAASGVPLDLNNYDEDPGTGAFGPEPGNVTINAGGNVYGNFMEINGIGTITAGGSIGTSAQNVALSMAGGSWNLNAQGNIYLQEVRNPNGVFNNSDTVTSPIRPTAGNHLFDYSPQASVDLTAGDGVYITGNNLPRPAGSVQMILPPSVIIKAGPGGVNLYTPNATDGNGFNDVTLPDYDITLFPSAFGNLEITTTGGGWLTSANSDGTPVSVLMSDSAQTHWFASSSGIQPFSENDHAATPAELDNPDPVMLSISGSMQNILLQVSKSADINISGDMNSCSFYGENLQPNQATSITVGGRIDNPGSFNQVTLSQDFASLPTDDLPLGTISQWFTPLLLAVNPALLSGQSFVGNDSGPNSGAVAAINNAKLFANLNIGGNLAYDSGTKTLTSIGSLSTELGSLTSAFISALGQPITVVRYGADGNPLLYPAGTKNAQGVSIAGQIETDTITLLPQTDVARVNSLVAASQGAPGLGANSGAYIVAGPGQFNVTAGSISLGNSDGILSVGNGTIASKNYSYLTPYIGSGATINVTAGYLEMPSSTIAALGGGGVTVNCTGVIPDSVGPNSVGVSMDLGSQSLVPFEATIMTHNGQIGLGIYSTGGGDVNVTGYGNINVDSSRIATFGGGDVNVTSLHGNVDAGSGGTIAIPVNAFSTVYAFPFNPLEAVYANGIVAETLADAPQVGATTVPGNISVNTPQGDIDADLGGILQESLSGSLPVGPTINLNAGSTGHVGNINLGQSGVIGGTINATASGNITGLLISQHNANVNAAQSFSGTILSGGTANVAASGSVSGTIIGANGVNASGGSGVSATLLGQNVSVNGGQAQSTLGNNATASATSQSAAQQSTQSASQQVASTADENDDQKKKKKKPTIHVGHVTVILSAAVPR